jgi:hypothetical protein
MADIENPGPAATGTGAGINSRVEQSLYARPASKSQYPVHLRRQRQVERLHALGARAVFELLDELDRHHRLGDDLDRRLDRYASLDPALVAAVGGDRFPHPALRVVGGVR